MINIFKLARHFQNILSARPDTEHAQAILRVLMSFPHILFALSIDQYASPAGAFSLPALIVLSSSLFFGGIAFLGHIIAFPDISHIRRWIGIFYDMTIIGATIYYLGDSGAPVFGMYIWVVIGNGFRYGIHFLYGAAALALLSFYIVAYFSQFYSSDVGLLVLATFLLGIVIPIYIGNLLKKLQQNLLAAREADRLKTRFLSNVSHDLRTPLNVIMANCDLLARGLDNDSRRSRQLQDMQQAATTLNGLVVDLLDVARIEAGRIKIMSSQFNMIELLGRVTRFNQSAAEANETQIYLTVAPDTPSQCYGDTLRLEQVLNNIVSNAVKYTENGEVAIYARPDIDEDTGVCNGIVCTVSDTGIGMDSTAMGRIFSRFEQADLAYARRYSGAGLGLNIANELTTLMGGSIDVKSTKGEGSCFTLTVPLRENHDFDFDSVFQSCRTPIAVICGNSERQRYWSRLLDEFTLPATQVLTIKTLASRIEAPAGNYAEPAFIVVDACELDISVDEAPMIASNFFGKPLAPLVLVNAPNVSKDNALPPAFYKDYRCWTCSTNPDDLKKALAFGYWTAGSEASRTESDDELWLWMSALQGLTVLVADDNELNRHVLSDMLAYANASIVEAHDGADALTILSERRIDIALLDIQMPGLTGVEVMRALAGQRTDTPVPMIALTADTTEECRAECQGAGASSILYKPVNMKTLYRALYQVVTDTDPVGPSLQQQNCAHTSSEQGLLDYALLQELTETGCHSDYVTTLVACFKQEGDQLLHGLRQAFDLNKITGSRSILHRLKGMCGSIGAREMAAICHESLTLSDTELCASAKRITTALFHLHRESAKQLDTFSEYSVSSNPVRTQSSPEFAKTGIFPVSQPGA